MRATFLVGLMTGGAGAGVVMEEGIVAARTTAIEATEVTATTRAAATEVTEVTSTARNVVARNEGIEVTEASIKEALKGSNMKTTQGEVSLPMVRRYVRMLEAGSSPPPIKVAEGNVLVDGNHRYVSGRLVGQEPTVIKGTMSPSQASRIVPIYDTKVNLADWGGH